MRIGYIKSKNQDVFEIKPIVVFFGKLAFRYHNNETGLGLTIYRVGKYFGLNLTIGSFNLLIRNENMGD